MTLQEVGEKGAVVGMTAFAGIIAILIMFSSSPSVAVERLVRFMYALSMTLAPTTPFDVFVSLFAAIIGMVSASRFKKSALAMLTVFVAVFLFISLSISYHTAPI